MSPLTDATPKCMVHLAGHPLLGYQLAALSANGITDVALVTGHAGHELQAWGLPTFHNPEFESTGIVWSLFAAERWLDVNDDVLVCYGDLVYEAGVIDALIRAAPAPVTTVVDLEWLELWSRRMDDPLSDAESLRICKETGHIVEIGSRVSDYSRVDGQYVGLTRIAAGAFHDVRAARDRFATDKGSEKARLVSMTEFLQWIVEQGTAVRAATIRRGWLEVDSVRDLKRYEAMIADGELSTLIRLPRPRVAGPVPPDLSA